MRTHAPSLLLLLAALASSSLASSDAEKTKTTTAPAPCTATSTSGAFYDLRPDMAVAVEDGAKAKKGVLAVDYLARGYDYGSNFTVNLCAAVVKPVKSVVGVDREQWRNVSAHYEHDGKVYSLG